MSLPVPLAVRLSTARTDRVVTRQVRDLEFRTTVPGGFASATIALDRPLTIQPDEIDYFGKLYVYDRRNGATVWEGLLEDPGRTAGADGQVWQLAGIGPSAHAKDRQVPLIYVDKQLQSWGTRVDNTNSSATVSVTADPADSTGQRQAVVLGFNNGASYGPGAKVTTRYTPTWYASQGLGRVSYTWFAGFGSSSYLLELYARTDGDLSTGDLLSSASWGTGGGSLAKTAADWAAGRNSLDLRIRYTGAATTVTVDSLWASVVPIVQGQRYNQSGTLLTAAGSYSTDTLLSSQVVADLLGRLLPRYDGPNASIATTSYGIDQLAYPDGVDPDTVLSDLMKLDPAYFWAAWESTSAGKYRFEWSPWPTSVRYEADVKDGFDSPGSADELYSGVRVRYRDTNGSIRTVYRAQTVPALTSAGVTRDAFLDLGDTVGTAANAQRAGDQFLADHANAPNAGRLTVARPILDLVNGRQVMPWEIRPGTLIRVRGVLPRVDALNATSRDGVTVFRVVGVTYRASTASAELELDSYPATVARALADLQRRPLTARR